VLDFPLAWKSKIAAAYRRLIDFTLIKNQRTDAYPAAGKSQVQRFA
jgi:hypothetical protein